VDIPKPDLGRRAEFFDLFPGEMGLSRPSHTKHSLGPETPTVSVLTAATHRFAAHTFILRLPASNSSTFFPVVAPDAKNLHPNFFVQVLSRTNWETFWRSVPNPEEFPERSHFENNGRVTQTSCNCWKKTAVERSMLNLALALPPDGFVGPQRAL